MYQTKIYVDVDDVIFNTSELVIDLLNKYYNIVPPKTIYDLKDWGFKSIYRQVDTKILEEFWESDEFFDNVKINEDFCKFYKKIFIIGSLLLKELKKIYKKRKNYYKNIFQNSIFMDYHQMKRKQVWI